MIYFTMNKPMFMNDEQFLAVFDDIAEAIGPINDEETHRPSYYTHQWQNGNSTAIYEKEKISMCFGEEKDFNLFLEANNDHMKTEDNRKVPKIEDEDGNELIQAFNNLSDKFNESLKRDEALKVFSPEFMKRINNKLDEAIAEVIKESK